jgi:hypothetical protein
MHSQQQEPHPDGRPIPTTPPATGQPVPAPPVPAGDAGPTCSCGHPRRAHEHYRRGSDCAMCGCGRFRRPRRLALRLGWRRR